MSKKQLLTDDEYMHIILMACTGKPQTEEQLLAVIKSAQEMRASELMLRNVLAGDLCMYADGSNIMFKLPNERI